jgi:superfamily I DNA and/or RNA helicase
MKKEELIDDMEVCFPWLQSSLHAESFFHKPYEVLLANLRDNKEQVFTNTQRANLNETHRFGQNLASVLDKYVYKNGFKGKDGGKTTEIIVIHADKVKGSKGRENPSEVKAIQQYLEKENPIDAVILSPYNNQVGLLGQSMRAMRAEQRILTVHKSQGREWDTVILSVSDTYDMFFTDTSDPNGTAINLINTAVSRAKKELVIVCDANFWKAQTNQLITGLIKVGKEYALLTT